MGIYSTNNLFGGFDDTSIPTNESYFGINGALNAMIDIEKNNNALFEGFIARDFLEAQMIHEGADELTLMSFNEATIGGIFDKIKAFLKKVWEKIKGIFSTFIKKLNGVIIKDNKELVKKYKKEVMGKNLSKLKYKWCERQDGFDKLKNTMISESEWASEANKVFNMFNDSDKASYKKIKDQVEDGDYYSEVINNVLNLRNVELKELAKEIHEYCFDTEESEEGLKSDRLTDIITVLNGDKTKTNVEKAQTAANKHFKRLIDNLDNISTQISKNMKTDKSKQNLPIKDLRWKYTDDDLEVKNAAIQAKTKNKLGNNNVYIPNKNASDYIEKSGVLQQAIQAIESVHTNTVSCFLNENKFNITQSRKVFMKAVSYNPKKAKNEAAELYLDAVEEAAEFEITSLFEDYSLDYNDSYYYDEYDYEY